jgi:hypothetical protein
MFKKLATAALLLFALTCVGEAQDTHNFDFAASGSALFVKRAEGSGVTQTGTTGLGLLGSLRVHFTEKSAIELSYGRAENSLKYQFPPYNYRVQGRALEFSGAYVRSLHPWGKIRPYFLAGGAALVFNPLDTKTITTVDGEPVENIVFVGASRQTSAAFLYGVGVERPLLGRFSLRLQYRGLLYKAPDFNVQNTINGTSGFFTGAYGHMAEPTVGIVFHFF